MKQLRITKQRKLILDALMSVKSHPTADELYQMVKKTLPSISLGTVYRNLEIMSDSGMIQKLEIGGTQMRFDGMVETHYHVRCTRCGRVDDLDMTPDLSLEEEVCRLTGFDVHRHSLEFMGHCSSCRA